MWGYTFNDMLDAIWEVGSYFQGGITLILVLAAASMAIQAFVAVLGVRRNKTDDD